MSQLIFCFSTVCLNKKYDIKTAESGIKGLEILDQDPAIRVVISDMRMPRMDGIQFISKAKVLYPVFTFLYAVWLRYHSRYSESLIQWIDFKIFSETV